MVATNHKALSLRTTAKMAICQELESSVNISSRISSLTVSKFVSQFLTELSFTNYQPAQLFVLLVLNCTGTCVWSGAGSLIPWLWASLLPEALETCSWTSVEGGHLWARPVLYEWGFGTYPDLCSTDKSSTSALIFRQKNLWGHRGWVGPVPLSERQLT